MEAVLNNYTNGDGLIVGRLYEVEGKKVYKKKVSEKLHQLKIGKSWGIDESILLQLEGRCDEIWVWDTDFDLIYITPLEVFKIEVFKKKGFVKDFGYFSQRFLSKPYWKIVQKGTEMIVQERDRSGEVQAKLL